MPRQRTFKEWFDSNGDELLKGWLRAKENGNQETFTGWVLGEYDFYCEHIKRDDIYEIPYHGICDEPSKNELIIYKKIHTGINAYKRGGE